MLALKVKMKILVNSLAIITILAKYSIYVDIFLIQFIIKFLKHNNNNYAIKLKKSKQLFYSLIYSLKPIELKILKIYIKISLANNLI